jgi:redox-sensitive bicupin YhaK (pirin superfamily)
VSPDGRDGSLMIHQDALIRVGTLTPGATVTHTVAAGRHAWLQVARGAVTVNGTALEAGDGASVAGPAELAIAATGDAAAELLMFDLP